MKASFKNLSKPIRIGSMEAKNRIWLSPMWTRLASVNGEVTDLVIDHYVARARGGAGLITQESTAVDGRHTWAEPELRIDNEVYLPGLHRLVDAVHMFNTPIVCQLHHAGMFGNDPVSPAGVACFGLGLGHYIQPRILSIPEIEEVRDLFIKAAINAKLVGYDGVELHGGTSYLLEQFFSPHSNKRTDKYGGSLENRMLLSLEILRGIRAACGPFFPVGYTLIDNDLLPGGIRMDEAIPFAKALEREGISYIDLQTRGTYETFHLEESRGMMRQKKGQFDITEIFKKELNIPVTTRGAGDKDIQGWETAISDGIVDAVRAGRQFLAEPDLAKIILDGSLADIRPCINELNCYESGVMKPWNLTCAVNCGLGKGEKSIPAATVRKKVLIIGGGPGGLEAARVSAIRGHEVTLLEKESMVGGNLVTASLPVGKEEIMKFIPWAERQCRNLGVQIELNAADVKEYVKKIRPDAVIVAAGATPLRPSIPGIDKPHVVTAEDVLKNKKTVSGKVIVVGGGLVGLETADLIVEKGFTKDLTIIEMLLDVGIDMNPMEKGFFFANIMPKIKIRIITGMKVEEISDKCIFAIDGQWRRHEFAADHVVMAVGYSSNSGVYDSLKDQVREIYVIGDNLKPRKVVNAVQEGNFIARQV